MTVISDVYFNVGMILSKMESTSDNKTFTFIFTALFLLLFLLAQCDPFYFVCSFSLFSNELWTFDLFKVSQVGKVSKKGKNMKGIITWSVFARWFLTELCLYILTIEWRHAEAEFRNMEKRNLCWHSLTVLPNKVLTYNFEQYC